MHAGTSGNTYGNGSSPTNQYDYYKLVYSIVESSIDTGSNIRGVAFWRWDAINTGDLATLSSLDAALTLSKPQNNLKHARGAVGDAQLSPRRPAAVGAVKAYTYSTKPC